MSNATTTDPAPAPTTTTTSILHDRARLCVFPIPKNRLRLWTEGYKAQRGCGWEPEEARLTAVDTEQWTNVLTLSLIHI